MSDEYSSVLFLMCFSYCNILHKSSCADICENHRNLLMQNVVYAEYDEDCQAQKKREIRTQDKWWKIGGK